MIAEWQRRPSVERSLWNPALTATLIASAARGHGEENQGGLPVALSFIVVPLVYNVRARRALPPSVATSLPTWIAAHPVERAGVRNAASSFRTVTREGLVFALQARAVQLDDAAWVLREQGRLAIAAGVAPDAVELARAARFVGRWFARAGSVATVLSLWGFGRGS
jgi:hypothetical protein